MPDAPDIIELICDKAGLEQKFIATRLPRIARTAAGGQLWETLKDHPSSAGLLVLFQFDHNHGALDSFLAGDVRVYCFPKASATPDPNNVPLRVTINRAHPTYTIEQLSPLLFAEAVGIELRLMATAHNDALYCTSDSCEALTDASADKCRVCGAELARDDGEGEEEEEEEEEVETAVTPTSIGPELVNPFERTSPTLTTLPAIAVSNFTNLLPQPPKVP
jgi:hypothetical protein